MSSAFEMIVEPRTAKVGNGTVRRVLPFRKRRMVGPFIFADLIGPEDLEPGAGTNIDAHPHIGLSTLTYLFAGRLVHRDSTGAVATIEPGAVWRFNVSRQADPVSFVSQSRLSTSHMTISARFPMLSAWLRVMRP